MRKYWNNARKEAAGLHLSDTEKTAGRKTLEALIELQPVRIETPARQRKYARSNTGGILFFNRKHMLAKGLLMAVLALSGGTSVAAEGALPGDTLYGVKTNINEEVRAAFSASTNAKAHWDARRAERRLEEAAELAVSGELTAEQFARLKEGFEKHTARVEERADRLEEEGKTEEAADVRAKLAAAIEFHESFFAGLTAGGDAAVEAEVALQAHLQQVRTQQKEKQKQRQEKLVEKLEENPEQAAKMFKGRFQGATNQVENVTAVLEKLSADLSAEESAEVQAAIDAANAAIVSASTSVKAEQYVDALQSIDTARESLHTGIKLLKVEVREELRENPEVAERVRQRMQERRDERRPGGPDRGPAGLNI